MDILRSTGSAAIDYTISAPVVGKKWEILEIKVHLSAAGGISENLTVNVDSDTSSVYDYNIVTRDMELVSDLGWFPDNGRFILDPDDEVDIAYANSNSRTYGIEVTVKAVYDE